MTLNKLPEKNQNVGKTVVYVNAGKICPSTCLATGNINIDVKDEETLRKIIDIKKNDPETLRKIREKFSAPEKSVYVNGVEAPLIPARILASL